MLRHALNFPLFRGGERSFPRNVGNDLPDYTTLHSNHCYRTFALYKLCYIILSQRIFALAYGVSGVRFSTNNSQLPFPVHLPYFLPSWLSCEPCLVAGVCGSQIVLCLCFIPSCIGFPSAISTLKCHHIFTLSYFL